MRGYAAPCAAGERRPSEVGRSAEPRHRHAVVPVSIFVSPGEPGDLVKTLLAKVVAERLNVPVRQVYRLIREGILKGYKDQDDVRVYADSLTEYLKTLFRANDSSGSSEPEQ